MKTFIVVDSKTEWIDATNVDTKQIVMCKPINPETHSRMFIVWDIRHGDWAAVCLLTGTVLARTMDFITLFKEYRTSYKMYAIDDI